jgi:hypothetical protein
MAATDTPTMTFALNICLFFLDFSRVTKCDPFDFITIFPFDLLHWFNPDIESTTLYNSVFNNKVVCVFDNCKETTKQSQITIQKVEMNKAQHNTAQQQVSTKPKMG